MKEYGYVRVSSLDQNEERQMVEMRQLGIAEKTSIRISSQARTSTVQCIRSCFVNLKRGCPVYYEH